MQNLQTEKHSGGATQQLRTGLRPKDKNKNIFAPGFLDLTAASATKC